MDQTSVLPHIEMNYEYIVNLANTPTSDFDFESPGILLLKKNLAQISKKAHKNILYKELMENLEYPFLSDEKIAIIAEESNVTNEKVKEFFRNQRKRNIQPIKKLFQNEIINLQKKIGQLDPYLVSYLDQIPKN